MEWIVFADFETLSGGAPTEGDNAFDAPGVYPGSTSAEGLTYSSTAHSGSFGCRVPQPKQLSLWPGDVEADGVSVWARHAGGGAHSHGLRLRMGWSTETDSLNFHQPTWLSIKQTGPNDPEDWIVSQGSDGEYLDSFSWPADTWYEALLMDDGSWSVLTAGGSTVGSGVLPIVPDTPTVVRKNMGINVIVEPTWSDAVGYVDDGAYFGVPSEEPPPEPTVYGRLRVQVDPNAGTLSQRWRFV